MNRDVLLLAQKAFLERLLAHGCGNRGRFNRPGSGPTLLRLLAVAAIYGSLLAVSMQSQNNSHAERGAATGTTRNTMVRAVEEKKKTYAPFYEALRKALKKRKTSIEKICPVSDPVARRILEDYGAVFLAVKKVMPPPVCVFSSEEEVTRFQESAGFATEAIADSEIELQPEAMKALLKAREEAQKEDLDITPRGGAEAARRTYEDSLRLWATRFLPALDYWLSQGRLTTEQVERLKNLPLNSQVAEVLALEHSGIFFSKDLSKSILYSIAAPGTSQHIVMLALDVTEFDNPRVREIMAKHGWFQTVLSDLPHFTYLGLKEKDLPKRGLKNVEVDGQTFWIPNVVEQPDK
jgi:hypothetical protein